MSKRFETSLSGGINNNTRKDLLNPTQVVDSRNLLVLENGSLSVGGNAVYDPSIITDFGDAKKFWLWRPFRKPYFRYSTVNYRTTDFLVYVFYKEGTTNYVTVRGVVNDGSGDHYVSQAPPLNNEIKVEVSQEPSIAFSGNRMTIVDGIDGTFSRFIEIDEDGIFITSEVGVNAPIYPIVPLTQEDTGTPNIGIGAESGSFFGYIATFVDKFGVESNPSPMLYNTSEFIGGDDQQAYRNEVFSPLRFIRGVDLSLSLINNDPNISDVEKINLYRSDGLYSESAFVPTEFSLIATIPLASSYSDYNSVGIDSKAVSYENDNQVRAEGIVAANTRLFITNTNNEVKFPIPYPKYIKIDIANPNSKTYINGVIKIFITGNIPIDFPAEPDLGVATDERDLYRFFHSDLTTPIPCLYKYDGANKTPTYHLRIPVLTAGTTTSIYLAYYPTGSMPILPTGWDKPYLGYPEQMDVTTLANFKEDSGDSYIQRYLVKDENNRIVLGGNLEDNGFSKDSLSYNNITFDNTVFLCRYENSIQDRLNVLTFDNTLSQIVTKDNLLSPKLPSVYTAYGWFNLAVDDMDIDSNKYYQIMGEVFDDDRDDGLFLYASKLSSQVIRFTLLEWDQGSETLLTPSLELDFGLYLNRFISWFIYMSVDSITGKIFLHVRGINQQGSVVEDYKSISFTFSQVAEFEDRWFYLGEFSNFAPPTIPPKYNVINQVTDFHFHEGLYVDTPSSVNNIADGRVIFDNARIGYDYDSSIVTNENMTFNDDEEISGIASSEGMLRWSDQAGLVFPTLNELQIGSKIIKVVPRIGAKNEYTSILDIYAENGIYILQIDNLSSATTLIPLTGDANSYVLINKYAVVRVGSSNYFLSKEGLIRQTGESFSNLTGLIINAEFDRIAYIKKYNAIGLRETGGQYLWLYDIKREIFTKHNIFIESFSDIDENDFNVIEDNGEMSLYPSTSFDISTVQVVTRTFYLENADLLRFRIEYLSEDSGTMRIISNYNQVPPAEYGVGLDIDLTINSGEWYYVPNGFRCESFYMILNGFSGIGKIEYEVKPRGRR